MTKLRGHNYNYVRFSVGGRYRMERRREDIGGYKPDLNYVVTFTASFFILFFITFQFTITNITQL